MRTMRWFMVCALLACSITMAVGAVKMPTPNPSVLQPDCPPQGDPALCMPLDPTFEVVPMASDGNCSMPAVPGDPCQRNDDDHSNAIALPFPFDLFGETHTEVYINNNGNLSFGEPFCTYTPEGFPVVGYPMVAPFWGDVDTSDNEGGVAWYRLLPTRLEVTWDHVGYFNSHDDLQNTFQVLISDGNDPELGIGNNVCFCFGDMQWATGDVGSGSGGFGGDPATVGVNKGDGTTYWLIGRFDHPGTDYDGPHGNPDGVDWLDTQSFCFSVASIVNAAPVPIEFPSGMTWVVSVGLPHTLQVGFISPEPGQITTVDVDTGGLANLTYDSVPGNPATVDLSFTPAPDQVGQHPVVFAATDDGEPPATTTVELTIDVRSATPVEPSTWGFIKARYQD
jgi:hypothetical protein